MTRSRYLKIILLILISTQMSFLSFGQLDNEWFDPSQRYFTFKIGQNGVYRLDYNTLLNFGIPLDEINPKTIQIFKNGEEQYLFVSGQDDNNFDINDFIEFYATKNEGFSLPSIEAMASGCLVIGYPGKGGKEYFKSEFSMPVPEKDIQQFAIKLEEGIQKIEKQSQFLDSIALKARVFIESHYNEVIEKQDIKNAWDYVLKANLNKSNA